MSWPMYSGMTSEQRMAWGVAEAAARIADLSIRSAEGLWAAQANAEARRTAIGASRSAATEMVIAANREKRRAA